MDDTPRICCRFSVLPAVRARSTSVTDASTTGAEKARKMRNDDRGGLGGARSGIRVLLAWRSAAAEAMRLGSSEALGRDPLDGSYAIRLASRTVVQRGPESHQGEVAGGLTSMCHEPGTISWRCGSPR